MSSVDISSLSVAELEVLKGSIDSAITNRRQTELRNLYQQIIDMIEESGFTLDEVLKEGASKKRIIKPKYCNPEDESQTWSGRGRKPSWVQELIEAGGDLDDCLI